MAGAPENLAAALRDSLARASQTRDHAAMLEVSDRLARRFQVLVRERDKRQQMLSTRVLAWERYEILGMLSAVNEERANLGKPPVADAVIELASGQACGHVDYATKFPFYCAEIVYGVFPLARES